MAEASLGPEHAVLRGLRRAGNEPQLTQVLAAAFAADGVAAAEFVRSLLRNLNEDSHDSVPDTLSCRAEEVVTEGRLDLRFGSADGMWDFIVELKLGAGYGRDWLRRYSNALSDDAGYAYVAAITRDVPVGEPPRGAERGWLGAVRWRHLLADLRGLTFADTQLQSQWRLFLDVLEAEGSMGFTRADPRLFDDYARARLAINHVEDLLRAIQHPLLGSLRNVLEQGEKGAALYYPTGKRFGRSRDGRTDIPFKIPDDGPWRLRAGIQGWEPPATFHVRLAPNQRWSIRSFNGAAKEAVESLRAHGFDPDWMHADIPLTYDLLTSPNLEEELVSWATKQFEVIHASGILTIPVAQLSLGKGVEAEEAS